MKKLLKFVVVAAVGVVMGSAIAADAAPPPASPPAQSVIVANTPLPVAGSVGVVGTVAVDGTVSVRDDRVPFEQRIDLVEFGQSVASGSFQVPAERRLVVEFVSVRINVPSGQTPLVSANASTGATGFAIPVELQGVGNGNAFFAGATPLLDFAPAGSFYTVSLERQNPNGGLPTGSAGGFAYISGYLLPA